MPAWLDDILAEPTTSVPLAGKALGMGRNAAYEAARRGDIKTIDIGKLKRVPTNWLRKVLQIDNANVA